MNIIFYVLITFLSFITIPAFAQEAVPSQPIQTNEKTGFQDTVKNILGSYVKTDETINNTEKKPTSDEIIYRTNIGRADDVALLIKRGASPNETNESGVPLISLAASRMDSECINVINVLLEAGADINKTDKRGQTALFYAAKNGNEKAVSYLLEKGIRYSAADNFENNARNIAYQAGKNNIVELFDNFVKNKNDEFRKQYDDANRQLKENYDSFKNSVKQAQEKQKYVNRIGADGKIIPPPSPEKISQIVHDLSFASCAASYWQFCRSAGQETELSGEDLIANIGSYKNRTANLSQSFIKDYNMGNDMAAKIVDISQKQIGTQLSNMPSNSARTKQGVGTLRDMNSRCNSIAEIWTAVSNQ